MVCWVPTRESCKLMATDLAALRMVPGKGVRDVSYLGPVCCSTHSETLARKAKALVTFS